MLEATEALLAEKGVEGFSLREAARRAGVSPAAPLHHFSDARGLLTAVAARAFALLRTRLEAADAAAGPDRKSRLRAQGHAYVRFAVEHRGGFDLMFRSALLDFEDPELSDSAKAAFAVLANVFQQGAAPGGDPIKAPPPAALGAWSMVHGFARLYLDGQFPAAGTDELEPLFDAALGGAVEALAAAP